MSDNETGLAGRSILVVEDELLVAMGLEDTLRTLGCKVIGPFPTLEEARIALDEGDPPDGAVLDVNVRGEFVFPLAERLMAQGTPVVLCSGYAEVAVIPPAYADLPRIAKPFSDAALVKKLGEAMSERDR